MTQPTIAGIHDHSNWAGNWLDRENQYSWLHAFRSPLLEHCTKKLYLAETYHSKIISGGNNLNYVLYQPDRSLRSIAQQIINDNPSLLFLNICWYKDAYPTLKYLREKLASTHFCIRIHHDVDYLYSQSGFLETVELCDSIITPTRSQLREIVKLKKFSSTSCQPFGVDIEYFRKDSTNAIRDIDLISFTNSHPARNYDLIRYSIKRLAKKGLKHENHTGLDRRSLSQKLSRSKYFLLSSMCEASGSRILLEALASGCIPIVLNECRTASEVLTLYNVGYKVTSSFRLKMPEKQVIKPLFSLRKTVGKIEHILMSEYNGPIRLHFQAEHSFSEEVAALTRFIRQIIDS